jgi:hypothetical protein
MKPVKPIIPGQDLPVTNYAENQPEYETFPVHRDQGGVALSRWRLTWREWLKVLITGDIYHWQHTFNAPMQPIMLDVEPAEKQRSFLSRWIHKRCHWQNLTKDEKGLILRHGRAWFHRAWNEDATRRDNIRFCWSFFGWQWLGFGINLFDGDNERDVTLSLGLWFCSFYLGFENLLPKRYGYPRHMWKHETGISITADGGLGNLAVSVDLHHAGGDCHDCQGWNGPHLYWWPLNTLLGRAVYSSHEIDTQDRLLQMPEGNYHVTVKLTEDRWKRPRWPWAKTVRRVHIECKAGIPKPGKGENSWDCGEDAAYGLTCPASTVEEALGKMKASVMRDRERYGGKSWRPATV